MMPEAIQVSWWQKWLAKEGLETARALEVTDPDPSTHRPKVFNFRREADQFQSVVGLIVDKRPSLIPEYSRYYNIAEQFETRVKRLPVEALLAKLHDLEKKAFRYDSKTHEAPVANFKAYLELKNYLKALERIAFEDPKYTQAYDLKEIHRLFILIAEEMDGQTRGIIHEIEAGQQNLGEIFERGFSKGMHFLKYYAGEVGFQDEPEWKRGMLLVVYLRLNWSNEEIEEEGRKYFAKHWDDYRIALLARGLSKEEVEGISKLPNESLYEEFYLFFASLPRMETTQERIHSYLRYSAFSMEISRRNVNKEEQDQHLVKVALAHWRRNFQKVLPSELLDKIERPFLKAMYAQATPDRIDNQKIKNEFLEAVKTSIEYAVANRADNRFFDAFIGSYIVFARQLQIPFRVQDLLAAANTTQRSFDRSSPLTWDKIYQRGSITIPFEAYPQTGDPYENEFDVLKQIHYQGVSILDLARQAVNTISFDPDLQKEGAVGTARILFRHIELDYDDENGDPVPFHQRLGVLAHEVFHNMEGFLYLSGLFMRGNYFSVLKERGALLFEAYVLKEYLKMRIENVEEKPISNEEIDQISHTIALNHFSATVANHFISSGLSSFDPLEDRIELPISLREEIVKAIATRKIPDLHPQSELTEIVYSPALVNTKGKRKYKDGFAYWSDFLEAKEAWVQEEKERVFHQVLEELALEEPFK